MLDFNHSIFLELLQSFQFFCEMVFEVDLVILFYFVKAQLHTTNERHNYVAPKVIFPIQAQGFVYWQSSHIQQRVLVIKFMRILHVQI